MKHEAAIARWAGWSGWRRMAPAAGSVATHVVIGVALASLLAAASKSRPDEPPARMLEVTLVAEAEAPPPPGMRPTPPQARRPPPDEKTIPLPDKPEATRPSRKPEKRQQPATASKAITGGAPAEDGGVYLGDATADRSGVPLGLQSLLESDPCNPKTGSKRGDCSVNWADRMAKGDPSIRPSFARLAEMYPGFKAPGFKEGEIWKTMSKDDAERFYGEFVPDCQWFVGCEEKEWFSPAGTRSVERKGDGGLLRGTPMASGPAGLGGPHDMVGRLPQKPDFHDRGFGD